MLGAVGAVKLAQKTKDQEWKGRLMVTHKSLALICCGLIPIRIGARLASKIPKPLGGSPLVEAAGTWMHRSLYVFMIGLPTTGMLMNYYSGRPMPFFWTTIKGGEQNKQIGQVAYKGKILEIFQALF